MNQNITNLTFTYFMKENFTLFHYALGYIFYYLKPISSLTTVHYAVLDYLTNG